MDRTSVASESEYQAAVAPRIRWVVLDQLPMLDDRADLVCGDHPIRSRHLSQCVWDVEPPLG